MPSLHFATSLMAALLLAEAGPVAGALGWRYAAVLGFALVYLGEHYVVDLLAGAALTGAVRRLGPRAAAGVRAASAARSRRSRRSRTRGIRTWAAGARERCLISAGAREVRVSGGGAARPGAQNEAGEPRRRMSEWRRDEAQAGEQRTATHHEEEMPRVVITRRQAIAFGLFVLTVVGFLYFVLPKLAGVGTTLHHLEHGDGWWIAIGVVLELLSFAGYVVLFRAVFVARPGRFPAARGARPDRLARELPDHDGRPGRDAPVRDRRRRGRRADRVGAAALGDGGAAGGLPDGRVHGAAVRGLCGLGADRRARARVRACFRAAARSR